MKDKRRVHMLLLQRWFEHYKQNSIIVGFFTRNPWHRNLLTRIEVPQLRTPQGLMRILFFLSKLIILAIIVTGALPTILIMDLLVAPIVSIWNLFSKKIPHMQVLAEITGATPNLNNNELRLKILKNLVDHLNLDQIKALIFLPSYITTPIRDVNCNIFEDAIRNGHLNIVNYLIELAERKGVNFRDPNLTDWFRECFHWSAVSHEAASHRNKLLMFNRITAFLRDNDQPLEAAISGSFGTYCPFMMAFNIDIIKQFIILGSQTGQLNEMLSAHSATRQIESLLRDPTFLDEPMKRLILSTPSAFAGIEQHVEYRHLVEPFIQNHLDLLNIGAQENTNINIQDPQKVQLYYFMARHLIRLNQRDQLPKIILLLSIPAVQAVADQDNNALLRLARRIGNDEAAEQLLQIPRIAENAMAFLASQTAQIRHNRDNPENHQTGLGLRQTAQNRENSMRSLSVSEQAQLAMLKAHYEPLIQAQGGLDAAWNAFINSLKSRYTQPNAGASLGNQLLPLDWNAFQALPLNASKRAEACQQYYQHPLHTAIRFLSKPNRWLHPDAGYLATTYHQNGRVERHSWADFEGYKPFILILWLAAKDTAMPPTMEGMSVENRTELLIKALALAGRRHNSDKHRPKKDRNNQVMRDATGQIITEEYDDGEGDRPSCLSGMNVEFFQALIGHPLFTAPITKQLIDTEIRDFMRACLAESLKNYSAADIEQKMAELEMAEFIPLNVTTEKQESFIHSLKTKYPQLETPTQAALLTYLIGRVSVPQGDSHVCRFWQEANLAQLCLLPSATPAVIFESGTETAEVATDASVAELATPRLA